MKTEKSKPATLPQAPSTHIANCNFYGVKFDDKAVTAINLIAEGLIENAKALGNLAHVLKASNVQLECMVKIDSSGTHISGNASP